MLQYIMVFISFLKEKVLNELCLFILLLLFCTTLSCAEKKKEKFSILKVTFTERIAQITALTSLKFLYELQLTWMCLQLLRNWMMSWIYTLHAKTTHY
jgi:hypothetical protein